MTNLIDGRAALERRLNQAFQSVFPLSEFEPLLVTPSEFVFEYFEEVASTPPNPTLNRPSGQRSIASSFETSDAEGHAVAFLVELRPGWVYGEKSPDSRWDISTSVEVDCLHENDHGAMHQFYESTITVHVLPEEAVAALGAAVRHLEGLATTEPVTHWVAMGGR